MIWGAAVFEFFLHAAIGEGRDGSPGRSDGIEGFDGARDGLPHMLDRLEACLLKQHLARDEERQAHARQDTTAGRCASP